MDDDTKLIFGGIGLVALFILSMMVYAGLSERACERTRQEALRVGVGVAALAMDCKR